MVKGVAPLLSEFSPMMPHGFCINWSPVLLAVSVISNALIFLAYFSIPIALGVLAWKRIDITYRPIMILFALFILACGTTHLWHIVTYWKPWYWTQAILDTITALVSVWTVFILRPMIPKLLSLPSHDQLVAVNQLLEKEIAERKKVEHALRDRSAKMITMLNNIPSMAWLKDEKGVYLFCNQPFAEMCNQRSPEGVIGKTDWDLMPKEMAEKYHADDNEVLLARQRKHVEEPAPNPKGGDPIWVETYKSPIIDSENNVIGTTGFATDITDRKLFEQQQEALRQATEHAAQVKSQFLASMSHEIRTPMNGIIGLSVLALNESMNDEVRGYLEKIASSSQSLLGILNDILDFSKLEAGKLTIESVPYRLDPVLETLHSVFGERALTKGINLFINVADNVPRELIGDSLRLQQILSNLLSNAIKFTASGEVVLKVLLLEQENKHATLRFSVEDSGIGMPQEVQDKLFEAFMQADSSTARTHGGTGLGLAISHQLLKLMGSDFFVQSEVGRGTTFNFDLKLGIVLVDGKAQIQYPHNTFQAGALTAELSKAGEALRGIRVLLAEDNVINQIVAKKILQLSGMEITIANNGQEALDLLEAMPFDIVLMDVHMPVMDGIDATRHIRENPKYADLPVIALTADVIPEEQAACLACGMNDVASKPIVPEMLLATIAKWVKFRS